MSTELDPLRDRLLAQQAPAQDRLDTYRKEVASMIADMEKKLRWQQWMVGSMWIYIVLLATAFLVIGGYHSSSNQGLWFGILACAWLLVGLAFLIPHAINRRQVELLKEIKGLEVKMMEIQEALRVRNP